MLQDQLQQGLQALGMDSDPEQIGALLNYLELLHKWNATYNLTAIRDVEQMVAYHVLDSLSASEHIPQAARCLDVGTGAGLPGIPLAIMLPRSHWILLDSNGKKTRFVQQAIAACELTNVKVVQSRVEDYHANTLPDVIISRAYASIEDFLASVDHLWANDKLLITMKTTLGSAEVASLDLLPYPAELIPVMVPGIAEKRSLVLIRRQNT